MTNAIYRWGGHVVCYALALLVAYALGYAFFAFPKLAIDLASQNRTLIITVTSAFIVGPIWIGYNRLSVFDKMDALPPAYRAASAKFARTARAQLIRPTVWMALVIMAMIALLSIGSRLPDARIVFAIAAPAFFLYMLHRLRHAISIILVIDKSIEDAQARVQKETARKKLIDSLREGRTASPLEADEHLAKYRRVINAP